MPGGAQVWVQTSGFQPLHFFRGNFDEVVPALLRGLDHVGPTTQLLLAQLQLPHLHPCAQARSGAEAGFSLPAEPLLQQSTTGTLQSQPRPARTHSSSRQVPFCANQGHLGSASPMPKGFLQCSCNPQPERCPHTVTLHRGNGSRLQGWQG